MDKVRKILSMTVGIIFILSALLKGVEFSVTVDKVGEYAYVLLGLPAMPSYTDIVLSACLIGFEFFLGLALLGQTYNVMVISGVSGMSFAFLLLNAYVYFFGGIEDCGCFGSAYSLDPFQSLIKSIIISAIIVLLIISTRRNGKGGWSVHGSYNLNCVWGILTFGFCVLIVCTPDWVDNHQYTIGEDVTDVDGIDNSTFYMDVWNGEMESTGRGYEIVETLSGLNILLFADNDLTGLSDVEKAISFITSTVGSENTRMFIVTTGKTSTYKDVRFDKAIIDMNLYKKIFHSNLGILVIRDNVITEKINLSQPMLYLVSDNMDMWGMGKYKMSMLISIMILTVIVAALVLVKDREINICCMKKLIPHRRPIEMVRSQSAHCGLNNHMDFME